MPPLALPEPELQPEPVAPRVDLEQLVQDHFSFIWRLLRRMGLPASDADDAAQQVFMIASAKLDKIRAGSERAFLYGCALHRVAKWQRGQVRQLRTLSLETGLPSECVSPVQTAEELLDRSKARGLLDAILAEMSVSLRSVFVLYELEQLSTLEIAELLGIPRGTAASRLRRAREEFERRVKRMEAHWAKKGAGR